MTSMPDHRHQPLPARVWSLLVDDDEEWDDDAAEIADGVAANGGRQIVAMTLQKVGDVVVDAKTVLAWLVTQLGGPASALALLVPIRESGSLLPQTLLVGLVQSRQRRKWIWVVGACGQAATVAAMAVVAATTTGTGAAWLVVALLGIFALARALSSLASKDVMGRTIPKGLRGRINGAATTTAGLVALTLGVGLNFGGDRLTGAASIAWLLAAAACAWLVAAIIYGTIHEPNETAQSPRSDREHHSSSAVADALQLLRTDRSFRQFVVARSLLLVSALSPPFVVALSAQHGAGGVAALGGFVIASGLAAVVGGRVWGRRADRSSRITMMWAALLGSATVAVFLAAMQVPAIRTWIWIYPMTHFALSLVHTGARVGRKTYLVDLAEGDDRTQRVAVSNSAMGVVLLLTGAVTGLASLAGSAAALVVLATMGMAGVVVSRNLPEVSAGPKKPGCG